MRTFVLLILTMVATLARADDWPTFRHDNHRSGVTGERLAASMLKQAWVWKSPNPPQPAWAGPAKWDAFANLRGLRSMRDYDPVFHPIAANGAVFFGSSADDSVYCLDAKTGKVRWTYTTDGPVRIAPTYHNGAIYFGSDDGYAYCLDAAQGTLRWKYRPVECRRRVLNNGRLISLWPCRTGVLVDRGTAYFAAGMLPWNESYLCAVDATTGRPTGEGRYVKNLSGVTMEGALLASTNKLFSPQGRVPPRIFARADGGSLGSLDNKGGGGCFALITEDAHLLHGPGNKTGWISDSDTKTRQRLASFPGGNAMVVSGDMAYLLTDTELASADRRSRKKRWTVPCDCPLSLILAGDVLFAGGPHQVVAFDAKDGKELWLQSVQGGAYGLATADGQLLVATDQGNVYSFAAEPKAERASSTPSSPPPAIVGGLSDDRVPVERADGLECGPLDLAIDPYVRFTAPNRAIIRWQTKQPMRTSLRYTIERRARGRIESGAFNAYGGMLRTEHGLTFPIRHNTVYHYRIIDTTVLGLETATPAYEFDTFFNYARRPLSARYGIGPLDAVVEVSQILSLSRMYDGICVVLGSGDGKLVYELGRQSRLRMIGVETDRKQVAAAREMLLRREVYGARTAVHQVDSLDEIPFVGGFADLVVINDPKALAEGTRLLKPGGVRFVRDGEKWALSKLPPREGGVWSHQYGRADNSGYGGESLGGAGSVDDLDVRWIGRPGPRAQADRNGRKPSPLSTGGRLFMQGLHRMIALDAYNGTILWSLELPHFERFNIPRDCSNWCADEEYVFAAMRDKCWQIDATDGSVTRFHSLPPMPGEQEYDWGYIASEGDWLIGSAVRRGTSWTNFWGGGNAGWYDARSGPVTFKVCSDRLFAIDKATEKSLALTPSNARWTHQGLIINPTITITDGRVCFVECRNEKVLGSESRRVGMSELWQDQFLVALDATTGRKLWEKPLDTADGTVVFYMAAGEGRLVIVSSDTKYHVYAFDVQNGSPTWDTHFDWTSNNHGKHMSRPAIHRGKVFVRPKVLDLANGKLLDVTMPDGGCGTYALTDNLVIFRNRNITLWDDSSNHTSAWPRLRPGCWLSTIPAAGMVLSPEAGGGCSCGNWLETSIGFAPVVKGQKQNAESGRSD